jgi:hypothetical protein
MKRLFFLLVILVIGTIGVGFWRGWFTASTAEAGGKKNLVISWDKDKISKDLGQAGSKLKAMSQTVVDKIKGKAKKVSDTLSELEGRVKDVDADNHTVTIESDGNDIPLTVADAGDLEKLEGKTVRVTLEKHGDTMVVTKIEEK